MVTALLQTLLCAAAGFAVWRMWRTLDNEDRYVRTVVFAGIVLRALAGAALFWISYLNLPIARGLQRGDGLWFYAPDAELYMSIAFPSAQKGFEGILFIPRSAPSVTFVQALGLFAKLFGSITSVAVLLNLICYLASCIIILKWKKVAPSARTAAAIAVTAISLSPSAMLWSLQPLKDTLFQLLVIGFLGAGALWYRASQAKTRGSWGWLVLAALVMIAALFGLAGIRWYVAFAVLGASAVFLFLSALASPHKLRMLAVSVLLVFVLSQAFVISGEPYISPTVRTALLLWKSEPIPPPQGITQEVESAREGFEHAGGGTLIGLGSALKRLEPAESKPASAPPANPTPPPPAPQPEVPSQQAQATPPPPVQPKPEPKPELKAEPQPVKRAEAPPPATATHAPTPSHAATTTHAVTETVAPAPAPAPVTTAAATPAASPSTTTAAHPPAPAAPPPATTTAPAPPAKTPPPPATSTAPAPAPVTAATETTAPVATTTAPEQTTTVATPAVAAPAPVVARKETPKPKPARKSRPKKTAPAPVSPPAPAPVVVAQQPEPQAAPVPAPPPPAQPERVTLPTSPLVRLAAGACAAFLPSSIARGMGLVDMRGGRGMWWFTDLDTLFFDAALIIAAVSILRRRRWASLRNPVFWLVVMVAMIGVPLLYVVTNFGTLFRLRTIIYIAAALVPLALATAPAVQAQRVVEEYEEEPPPQSEALADPT